MCISYRLMRQGTGIGPPAACLIIGDVLLCDLNPVAGREQGGIPPVIVVSHHRYAVIPGLFLEVPCPGSEPGGG